MARPLRIECRDGLYHVTSRGLERRRIARDDEDRGRWVDLLDTVATRRRWRVLAWALMGNHFHLFVRTPDANLSAGMHDLDSGCASGFNRRHGRRGPLFQGRFKAIVVESGQHEWELTRYIHLNPVRAGLATDPAAYRWSSCRSYFRASLAPDWLVWQEVLCHYGRTVRAARRTYRAFLAEGLASRVASPLRAVVASTLLGSPGFIERMRRRLAGWIPDRDVPASRALAPGVSLETIERAVCAAYGVEAGGLHRRGRHDNEPRRLAVALAKTLTTQSLRALGQHFGGVGPGAVSNMARQVSDDRRLARRLAQLVRRCQSQTQNE